MCTSFFRIYSRLSRWMLGLVAILLLTDVHAQALRVVAANASNSSVYELNFSGSGGSITELNTDQNAYVSFRSLVFLPNTSTGKIDLLVADTSRGVIVRYADAQGVGTPIWSAGTGTAGPTYPDGLSVDGTGNLFVVSSASGNKPAQLWAFKANATSSTGFDTPKLVGSLPVQGLEETVVARTGSNAAAAGDLLVLTSSPATVLVYSAASIQTVLNGAGQVSPTRTLISTAQFPAGVSPGGMDFWPIDNSLLITTGNGVVLRYSFTATSATRGADFTSGLGNGKFKVKTGLSAGIPYAFVADNNGGDILKFGAPPATGSNPPLATITAGVQHPQGLAASNLGATIDIDCVENRCDNTGGIILHQVTGGGDLITGDGYVIEDSCVVQIDPRIAQYGTCTGHSLPVSQVCAGYGNTIIPDHMCGSSGSSGSGFVLVKSLSDTLSHTKGILLWNDSDANYAFSSPSSLTCPQVVIGWAPLEGANEGTIFEGNIMPEMTGFCDPSGTLTRAKSLWGIGLQLNVSALPGKNTTDKLIKFAVTKYEALNSTIASANIASGFRSTLTTCVNTSRQYFDKKKYANAAAQLLTCDTQVAANESSFSHSCTPSIDECLSGNPNPSGEIRGRLANIYLTINTRIEGKMAPCSWPDIDNTEDCPAP